MMKYLFLPVVFSNYIFMLMIALPLSGCSHQAVSGEQPETLLGGQRSNETLPTSESNPRISKVSVFWEKTVGELTADHWGVADFGPGMKQVNTAMAKAYERMRPGVVRAHHHGLSNSWIDNEHNCWNKTEIKRPH